jgi:uncharacterized membrane protein YphA (DoxX/SURF4 family)
MLSKIEIFSRIFLGLILFVIGLNKFFYFLPTPPPDDFIKALINTGYMWELVGITEVVAGILLLINKWKGFALIFSAIISVNIVLYRSMIDSTGIELALLVAILNILLMYFNWSSFKSLFQD